MTAFAITIAKVLREYSSTEQCATLIRVSHTKGSTPQRVGAWMMVVMNTQGTIKTFGTIGGGHLEYQAIALAKNNMIDSRHQSATLPLCFHQSFVLSASSGQCCGGVMELAFAVLNIQDYRNCLSEDVRINALLQAWWPEQIHHLHSISHLAPIAHHPNNEKQITSLSFPTLMLFGAGHVGRACMGILAELPFPLVWIDPRDEAFSSLPAPLLQTINERNRTGILPRILQLACDHVEGEVAHAPANSIFVVMTHDHALDSEIGKNIIARGDYAFFGLIGSHSKRLAFLRRWREQGVLHDGNEPAFLSRFHCPVGISDLMNKSYSKDPTVIAISIVAQVLALVARR